MQDDDDQMHDVSDREKELYKNNNEEFIPHIKDVNYSRMR